MFALVPLDGDPASLNLKCDPELALHLRAKYAAVRPGYHRNKRHWNTVHLDGSIDDDELRVRLQYYRGFAPARRGMPVVSSAWGLRSRG